ncbi:hypothetical protein D917_09441 [Trichinella nativa]|uniref:Uncharacterized protein n=1 Tax=Trichinella nativa TaxID=6335 RepID=A0A1Y3EGT3_9BILA|nr:hypothetical protein D917_09441 [Trichinella nativa]
MEAGNLPATVIVTICTLSTHNRPQVSQSKPCSLLYTTRTAQPTCQAQTIAEASAPVDQLIAVRLANQ